MNKDQIEQRLSDLEALAREKGVYDAIAKIPIKIKKALQEGNPNILLINTQLDSLEKNILNESNPQYVLTRLAKQLEDRIYEIENNDIIRFDTSRPLSHHPFDLLQYNNLENKITQYEEEMTQLIGLYRSLINSLPQSINHMDELKIFLSEKVKLQSQYNEIKNAAPKIKRINHESTLNEIIAKHKDKIEIQGYAGRTPLIQYAVRGAQNLMAILLENGANINAQSDLESLDQGNTALIWLIANAYVNQALWLINLGKQYGINYDLFGYGNTALHLAIAKGPTHTTDEKNNKVPNGFRNIIIQLIDQGADVNLQDKKNGFSPLHLAVLHRDIEIIQKLMLAGANANCEDMLKRKPIEMLTLAPKDIKEILQKQSSAFTFNEDNWKERGLEIQKLLAPVQSSSPELHEDSESTSSSSSNSSSYENIPVNLMSQFQDAIDKLSNYTKKLKVDAPKTARQRAGNTKAEKIEELFTKMREAQSLEAIQELINTALKSTYKKGLQQNPLLVNRGTLHAYWIHSLFNKKRNTEAKRLSRSTTEDLLIDLKKDVDSAVEENIADSKSANPHS